MQTKKILPAFLLLALSCLSSCKTDMDMKKIYGTWIQINDSSPDDPKSTEELSFTEDGKYTVKYYTNGHVVDSMKGTFELDLEKKRIDIADVFPKLKDMTVIKLTETEMSVEISDDLSTHFTSNYRRQ